MGVLIEGLSADCDYGKALFPAVVHSSKDDFFGRMATAKADCCTVAVYLNAHETAETMCLKGIWQLPWG